MHLHSPGTFFHYLRKSKNRPDNSELLLVDQRSEVYFVRSVPCHAFFFSSAKDTANPRMRILNIENRIVRSFFFSQFQIEIQMRIGTAHQKIISCGIDTHLIHHIRQRFKLTGSGGHGHFFACPQKADKLNQKNLEDFLVIPHRLQNRLHARHITMMVGTHQVDEFFKSTTNLILVISDV